jgi:hypothetical protein
MTHRCTVPLEKGRVKKTCLKILLQQSADDSDDMQRDRMQSKFKIPAHHHGTHEHQIVRVRGNVPSSGTAQKTSKLLHVREFCRE